MEQLDGIKAQHAVFRAIQMLLARANTDWSVEESEVGSADDINGVDIRLIAPDGTHRLLDVSLGDKPDKPGMLVRVYRDWFEEEEDGSWTLVPGRQQDLLRRGLLPTMSAPPVGTARRTSLPR